MASPQKAEIANGDRCAGIQWRCCHRKRHRNVPFMKGKEDWEDVLGTFNCSWPECNHRRCGSCDLGFAEMQYDPYFSSRTGGKEKLKQKRSNGEEESDDCENAEEKSSERKESQHA